VNGNWSAIVGGVVGGVALFVVIVVGVNCVIKNKSGLKAQTGDGEWWKLSRRAEAQSRLCHINSVFAPPQRNSGEIRRRSSTESTLWMCKVQSTGISQPDQRNRR
jgi:hypothetical protein